MKQKFVVLMLIVLSYHAFAQNQVPACKCLVSMYSGTKADTVFHLPGKPSIVLCGGRDTEIIKGKVLYQEFVLSVCGSNKILKFWDAVKTCNVRTVKDTLLVETLVNLPVGKSMVYQETVWTIERIYFVEGKPVLILSVNRKVPKYSQSQISKALALYKQSSDENTELTSELADKLFISTISGGKKAKTLLINFRQKFKSLDGIYFEDYDSLIRMLKQWEMKSSRQGLQ